MSYAKGILSVALNIMKYIHFMTYASFGMTYDLLDAGSDHHNEYDDFNNVTGIFKAF